jgi:hypothetical protein
VTSFSAVIRLSPATRTFGGMWACPVCAVGNDELINFCMSCGYVLTEEERERLVAEGAEDEAP